LRAPFAPVEERVRWEARASLREAGLLLAAAGQSRELSDELRSKALYDLGNDLDSSGRWLEAYEAYKDALIEYPDNGNAVGNLAALLAARIRLGRGQTGHYAALHQKYATMAKALRAHTVAVANEAAAKMWDSLPELQNVGHEAHVGDESDPYQSWIVRHRFAGCDRWNSHLRCLRCCFRTVSSRAIRVAAVQRVR
jgi:tetratricopeptide (TPR) repeat protein